MSGERTAARSRLNALHWIGAAAAIGLTIWWWSEFAGPFRWLVDRQVDLIGRYYWEPATVALLLPTMALADLLDPLVPRLRDRTWGWLFVLAALVGSGLALRRAWFLWTAPGSGPAHRYPPLRTLDLDRLGAEPLPPSIVRIVGRADPREQVTLWQDPRGSHFYQPIGGLHRPAADLPIPVLATCTARRNGNCTPDTSEGWLVPARVADRDSYRLRRAGVVKDAFYLLSPLPTAREWVEAGPGEPDAAIAIALFLGLFWLVVAITAFVPRPRAAPKPTQTMAVEDAEAERGLPYGVAIIGVTCFFGLLTALGLLRWALTLLPF